MYNFQIADCWFFFLIIISACKKAEYKNMNANATFATQYLLTFATKWNPCVSQRTERQKDLYRDSETERQRDRETETETETDKKH